MCSQLICDRVDKQEVAAMVGGQNKANAAVCVSSSLFTAFFMYDSKLVVYQQRCPGSSLSSIKSNSKKTNSESHTSV